MSFLEASLLSDYFYLADSDLVIKLVTLELFDKALNCLNLQNDPYVLKSTLNKLENDQKKKSEGRYVKNSNVDYEKVIPVFKRLPHIPENLPQDSDFDIDLFSTLKSTENIDKGEAILTTVAISKIDAGENVQILTGDKRFIKALALFENADVINKLNGKIWCFEQVFLKTIERYGFDAVKKLALPNKDCDGVIRNILELNSANKSLNKLHAYIEELRNASGSLLHSYYYQT